MSIVWLGLYLSLNYTTPVWFTPSKPAVETTAIVAIGKLTVTGIYIQPTEKTKPLYSVGIGMRLF